MTMREIKLKLPNHFFLHGKFIMEDNEHSLQIKGAEVRGTRPGRTQVIRLPCNQAQFDVFIL